MRALIEWTRRLLGSLRRSRSDEDLQEELRLHLELAADHERRLGSMPEASARAARLRAGGLTQAMETLRDQRGLPRLDALIADVVFGWRQIARHRSASVSAILSLGLAMGATIATLRLVDAVLLRPLPVANPSRLFAITINTQDVDGRADDRDDFDYRTFRRYVTATDAQAEVMLVGMAVRRRIQVDGAEPEPAIQQFVSGNVFATLGLQPALGRLLGPTDDVRPNGHPVAVISHQFWLRRFGGERAAVGRTLRVGAQTLEIVGVAPKGFTGTEPGMITDFFLPAMMNAEALDVPGWSWFRIWVRPRDGVEPRRVLALLQARFQVDQRARVKAFAPGTPQSRIDAFLAQQLVFQPAGSGVSGVQKSFRRPLWILAALVALLLLIACANVANLLLARAMARRTELALRLAIGAARARLVQLMLIESALLALMAAAVGAAFAAWAAPVVVSMLAPAQRPVELVLALDWRTLGLGTAVTLAVTILFGLAPALRASADAPIGALKEPRGAIGQRRLSDALLVAQTALCIFLLFGASLFLGTFERLQNKPLGFDPAQLISVVVEARAQLPVAAWEQLTAGLRESPGVESAAVAGWAPLSGNRWRSSVSIDGRTTEPGAPNWVTVSPGYFQTMRIPIVRGREFRSGDRAPGKTKTAGAVAIVNQAFARAYMAGQNPVGRQVVVDDGAVPMEIVGMAADTVYFSVREEIHPAVYVPLESRTGATVLVRMSRGRDEAGRMLGAELPRIRPGLVVREALPFDALVTQQMVRERLLAALSTFLATLALLLAMIGIYGVLNYGVTRERREIAMRMALGARPSHVLTLVTWRLIVVIGLGSLAGVAAGIAFGRTVRTLLFDMQPTDPVALLAPVVALAAAAVVAAVPPALRAIRIDPGRTINSET